MLVQSGTFMAAQLRRFPGRRKTFSSVSRCFHLKLTSPSQCRHSFSVTMWLLLLPEKAGGRGEISEDSLVHFCCRSNQLSASLSASCEDDS